MSLKPWLLLPVLALAFIASAEEPSAWTEILVEDGVTIESIPVAGRALPRLRGKSVIDAPWQEILAVLNDVGRMPEWAHLCSEARRIRESSPVEAIVYNRTEGRWPVSDRDVVLKSEAQIGDDQHTTWVRFRSTEIEELGEVDGVVRMPLLEGHYRLEPLPGGHTRVEYQIDADPGGRLPKFLVREISKDIPLRTLLGLRRQVQATRGQYVDTLERLLPSVSGAPR